MMTGVLYLRAMRRRFESDVEAILHGRRRQHRAGTVTMTAEISPDKDHSVRRSWAGPCLVRRAEH